MEEILQRINYFYKYRPLLIQLVKKDIKLKYRRSFLGYLWSILNPLMIMVIMVLVFQQMFRFSIDNYPAYVICGQVCFNFLSESTNQAIHAITGNAALLKKTYVPKYIFAFAKVTSGCVNLLFSLGALFLVFLFFKVKITAYMLLLPWVLLQLYIFCLGLGLLLSTVNVYFRDIQYIYSALLMVWMYMTPLFYPLNELSEELQWFIKRFNPLYYYVTQLRDIMLNQQIPGIQLMLAGVFSSIISLVIGIWIFLKLKDSFILYI